MISANPKHDANLSLCLRSDGPTIKKYELDRLIQSLPDNAEIYLFTTHRSMQRAVAIAAEVGTQVLSFSLTGEFIEEPNGISLVAKAAAA